MTSPPTDPSRSAPSRRAVLAGASTLLAAGAAQALPVPAVHRRRRPSDSLRVGFVGIGARGHSHLQTLGFRDPECPGCQRYKREVPVPNVVELVAVCDAYEPNLDRAQRHAAARGHEAARYVDHRRMLEEQDLDAVWIATPDHSHTLIALDAVRAGADAYVEKALSVDVPETYTLKRALEETGRIVQVGYQLRQDEIRRSARALIERGTLGKVVMVQDFVNRSGMRGAWVDGRLKSNPPQREHVHWETFLAGAPAREYDASRFFEWRKYRDYGTGIFGDLQSHSVDSANILLDLPIPTAATAAGGIQYWKDGRDVPDTVSVTLEYAERSLQHTFLCTLASGYVGHKTLIMGTDATMELGWKLEVFPDAASPKHREAIARGEESPHEPFLRIQKNGQTEATVVKPSELWLEGRGMTVTSRDGETFDTTRLHHLEFLQSVRTREQPSASFDSALPSTIASHMACEAYEQGRRVVWDEESHSIG